MKQYLTFTKSERTGTLVLVFLILVVLAVYILLPRIITGKADDFSEFKKEIEAFEKSQKKIIKDRVLSDKISDKQVERMKKIEFFEFDPNNLSVDKWESLGLSDKTINTIRKYLRKGGRFYKPDDLKKIYGLNIVWYKQAKPYIKIRGAEKTKMETGEYKRNRNKIASVIELNSVDSLMLTDLRGIGPVLAKRIIKYRNLLGGFTGREQLLEVYGLPYETYENITGMINIDTAGITKIDLNKATYSEFIRHPYLDVYTVKGILKYRDIQGNIKTVDELKDNRIITEDSFLKIKPYLVVSIPEAN